MGVPLSVIGSAVEARILSSLKDERVAASSVLKGPSPAAYSGNRQELIDAVRDALYASKIISYAQGMVQLGKAGELYNWNLNFEDIASIWRGGCIIRARFLNRIVEAYAENPELPSLLVAPYFADAVSKSTDSWRRVVAAAATAGVATPAFSSSLAYYDGLRRDRLPAALIQGLRDFFGAHTYKRTDMDGAFHIRWSEARDEVNG
jgi:6-phosphogluconate dehydrogenase